jgi:hypothetical protein
MHTYETDCGRTVAFLNEEAYEAAIDWYNAHSKDSIINAYTETDGAIYEDADCSRLMSDWADLCMAAWAADHFGKAAFVWK